MADGLPVMRVAPGRFGRNTSDTYHGAAKLLQSQVNTVYYRRLTLLKEGLFRCSQVSAFGRMCVSLRRREARNRLGHMKEESLASIKGKTVQTVVDLAPNIRITFTDGSCIEFEAVACGDLRVRYWSNTQRQA